MSLKVHQQYRAPEGTKVYIVDPEKLRQNVVQHFQTGKTNNTEAFNTVPSTKLSQVTAARKPRKRRLESEEAIYEEEDDVVYAKLFSKQVTTRAGRVTKSKQTGPGVKLPIKNTEQVIKGKKREPASIFRCPTCQKVYIGYAKLKLHFRKFPDHYNYNNDEDPSELNGQLKKSGSFVNSETQTDLISNTVEAEAQTTELNRPTVTSSPLNVDHNVGDNSSQPQRIFDFRRIISPKTPSSYHVSNENPSNFYSQTTPISRSDRSNGLCNFGTYKSLNVDHNTKIPAPVTNDELPVNSGGGTGSAFGGISMHCSSISLINNGCHNGHSPLGHHHQHVPRSHTLTPVSPTLIKNTFNYSGNGSSSENNHGIINGLGYSLQRLIWDVIEDKMIQHGINEILAELSDVADKLAKIARDKIIPIREEEEEQLRVNNTAPIVQVDTPFLSHLLDLPFGTYMFKEDAGIRRLPHPPAAADLSLNSLTGGVEVDIDKFLPEIDLNNLPHLSNIDFSSICSDS